MIHAIANSMIAEPYCTVDNLYVDRCFHIQVFRARDSMTSLLSLERELLIAIIGGR